MHKFSPYAYFQFGIKLSPLKRIEEGITLGDLFLNGIRDCQAELYSIMSAVDIPFKRTAKIAKTLLDELDSFFPASTEELKKN